MSDNSPLLHHRSIEPRLGLTSRSGAASPRTPLSASTGLGGPAVAPAPQTPSGFGLHQPHAAPPSTNVMYHSWPLQSPGQLNAAYMATKRRRPWSRIKQFARGRPLLCAAISILALLAAGWWIFRMAPALMLLSVRDGGSGSGGGGSGVAILPAVVPTPKDDQLSEELQRSAKALQEEKDKMKRLAAEIESANAKANASANEAAPPSAPAPVPEPETEPETAPAPTSSEQPKADAPAATPDDAAPAPSPTPAETPDPASEPAAPATPPSSDEASTSEQQAPTPATDSSAMPPTPAQENEAAPGDEKAADATPPVSTESKDAAQQPQQQEQEPPAASPTPAPASEPSQTDAAAADTPAPEETTPAPTSNPTSSEIADPAPAPAPAPAEDSKPEEQTGQPATDSALHKDGVDRSLDLSDLASRSLRCFSEESRASPCDWSWGPPGSPRSPNSEEHPSSDVDPEKEWKQPQDFYSFQVAVHVGPDGPGALVRIFQRDQCCAAGDGGDAGAPPPLPLSYFRVTAVGAAQAAANPPLSLGPLPAAMGRGHQELIPAHTGAEGRGGGWSSEQVLRVGSPREGNAFDDQRVLQTFLLLPDAGHYQIQVKLLLFNASSSMVSENFVMASREYEARPGVWVDAPLQNNRGEKGTKILIPARAADEASVDGAVRGGRESLPLCGAEPSGTLGGLSPLSGHRYGMLLAGRWRFDPPRESQSWSGYTVGGDPSSLDPQWLVEHSEYLPYFCRLSTGKELIAEALTRLRWVHFTGDSNTHYWSQTVCEMAGGSLQLVRPEAHIPKRLDAPEMCHGPKDEQTGEMQWVITYTNWFWGKEQTLQHPFVFGEQCSQFVEQNTSYVFRGWPACDAAPKSIQSLPGPGVTWFGWGSHAAEFGANRSTDEYFNGKEAFGLEYFAHHPTLFPLTSANTPSLIPDKFGKQQVMRNNERVHAANLALVDAVLGQRHRYASVTPPDAEGHRPASRDWLPLMDVFSPTHAAFEGLHQDAVHYKPFYGHWVPRWIAHYLTHAPNFGGAEQKH